MDGMSHTGPWRACKNSGDAMWSLSAGCSKRYSEPASRPARRSDAVRSTRMRYVRRPRGVIAIADRWRSTVRHVGLEETTDREGGARRPGYYRGVCPGRAAFE
eukprot:6186548-Pleurochrysis_carterae.AAC.2